MEASPLAKAANDTVCLQDNRDVLKTFASGLAPPVEVTRPRQVAPDAHPAAL